MYLRLDLFVKSPLSRHICGNWVTIKYYLSPVELYNSARCLFTTEYTNSEQPLQMAHIVIQVGAVFSATSVGIQLIKNLSKLPPFVGGPWNLPHKFHLYLIIKFHLYLIIKFQPQLNYQIIENEDFPFPIFLNWNFLQFLTFFVFLSLNFAFYQLEYLIFEISASAARKVDTKVANFFAKSSPKSSHPKKTGLKPV